MAKLVDEWELFYHKGTGRGEFVRILFADAGVPFKEYNDMRGSDSKYFVAFGGKPSDMAFPAFAPPMVRHNKAYIGQTNTVVRYVSTKLNLLPSNELDQFYADMLMANIQDIFSEMSTKGSGKVEEKEEWLKTRGVKWFALLNEPLTREKKQEYYFGNKCSCADLIMTVFLETMNHMFGKKYEEIIIKSYPALHALRERVEKRPGVQSLLEDRKKAGRIFYQTPWFEKVEKV